MLNRKLRWTMKRKTIHHCHYSSFLWRVDFSSNAVLWSVILRVIHSLTHPPTLCHIQIVLPALFLLSFLVFLTALNKTWDMLLLAASAKTLLILLLFRFGFCCPSVMRYTEQKNKSQSIGLLVQQVHKNTIRNILLYVARRSKPRQDLLFHFFL